MARFPDLGILDDLNYKSIAWGFPFLTIGIITGATGRTMHGAHTGAGTRRRHGLPLYGLYMQATFMRGLRTAGAGFGQPYLP